MHGKVAVKEKLIGQRTISFGVRAVASVSGGNNNEPAAKKYTRHLIHKPRSIVLSKGHLTRNTFKSNIFMLIS